MTYMCDINLKHNPFNKLIIWTNFPTCSFPFYNTNILWNSQTFLWCWEYQLFLIFRRLFSILTNIDPKVNLITLKHIDNRLSVSMYLEPVAENEIKYTQNDLVTAILYPFR